MSLTLQTSDAGNDAYRKGLCKQCCKNRHQAGSTMCAECCPMSTGYKPVYAVTMWGNVTDEQRDLARAASNTRQNRHEVNRDNDYQIADKPGNVGHYQFLIACFGFWNHYGGPGPDLTFRRGGTRDSGLRVMVNGVQRMVIPKANVYKGEDARLRVPRGTEVEDAVYVAAEYYDPPKDDVVLRGWEAGRQLVLDNDLGNFKGREVNYTKPYVLLRSMELLKGVG